MTVFPGYHVLEIRWGTLAPTVRLAFHVTPIKHVHKRGHKPKRTRARGITASARATIRADIPEHPSHQLQRIAAHRLEYMFVRSMLRTTAVGMWNPDGWQAQNIGEGIIG